MIFAPSDPPKLSEQVGAALERSGRLAEAMDAVHPRLVESDDRSVLAVQYLSIGLEHRAAILLLIGYGARTSAFGLVRACYESVIRGLWTLVTATDNQIFELRSAGIAPGFDKVVRDLSKNDTFADFAKLKAQSWGYLSDYAHSGPQQLSRWLSEKEGIAPVHSDAETVDLLAFLDTYAYMACVGIHGANGEHVPDSELVK